ncbi:short coiled-coil protein isoform X4 [Parus major]|uniref:short coiled-coil protein isoform X4 n=1 Tax=Parus major TaxID=9157 RepID=UPI0007712BB7|nr:short coiled-coil protein isoform X4 [Parus major]
MTRSQPLPQSPLVAVKKGWRSRPAPRAAQAHWQRRAGRAGPGQSPREAVAAGQVRGRCRGVDPEYRSRKLSAKVEGAPTTMMNADMDAVENQVELEEKTRLINQVLELQHTLEDLSARVDAVKEENLKLKSENQVLGQYIENLMSASSVFQTTDTKSKRK